MTCDNLGCRQEHHKEELSRSVIPRDCWPQTRAEDTACLHARLYEKSLLFTAHVCESPPLVCLRAFRIKVCSASTIDCHGHLHKEHRTRAFLEIGPRSSFPRAPVADMGQKTNPRLLVKPTQALGSTAVKIYSGLKRKLLIATQIDAVLELLRKKPNKPRAFSHYSWLRDFFLKRQR